MEYGCRNMRGEDSVWIIKSSLTAENRQDDVITIANKQMKH